MRLRARSAGFLLLLLLAGPIRSEELRPGALPPGVTVFPSSDAEFCKLLELAEPADVLVQGPLPDFSLWTPTIKDGGKLVVVAGKAGDYNVLIFPTNIAPGTPRVKGFTMRLGPPKPPPSPPKPPVPPTPNPYSAPSATWQTAVGPVKAIKLSRDDATNLAKIHAQAQAQLAAGVLKTTDALRAYLVAEIGKLNIKGKYANLAAALEKVMTDRQQLAVRPIEQGDTDAMGALAWALWEAGK